MNADQFKEPLRDQHREVEADVVASAPPDLRDPHVVLSLLEADQVVAVKQQTRFGRRPLSFSVRLAMWSLRVYVIVMFVIVVISVVRALHGGN